MSRVLPHDKGDIDPEHLEIVQNDVARQHQTHYRPVDDEEKGIDRRVNLKLDLIVVSLLAVEFIVSKIANTSNAFFLGLTQTSSVASTKPTLASSRPARSSKMRTFPLTISQTPCHFSRLLTCHFSHSW